MDMKIEGGTKALHKADSAAPPLRDGLLARFPEEHLKYDEFNTSNMTILVEGEGLAITQDFGVASLRTRRELGVGAMVPLSDHIREFMKANDSQLKAKE